AVVSVPARLGASRSPDGCGSWMRSKMVVAVGWFKSTRLASASAPVLVSQRSWLRHLGAVWIGRARAYPEPPVGQESFLRGVTLFFFRLRARGTLLAPLELAEERMLGSLARRTGRPHGRKGPGTCDEQ